MVWTALCEALTSHMQQLAFRRILPLLQLVSLLTQTSESLLLTLDTGVLRSVIAAAAQVRLNRLSP